MNSSPLQGKLTIGQPGDKYEQEADEVAAQVVQRINEPQTPPTNKSTIQTRPFPVENQNQQNPETSQQFFEFPRFKPGEMTENINRSIENGYTPREFRMDSSPLQGKLTIGEPGDKYEQEADEVAAQVVQRINEPETPSTNKSTIQTKPFSVENQNQQNPETNQQFFEFPRFKPGEMIENINRSIENGYTPRESPLYSIQKKSTTPIVGGVQRESVAEMRRKESQTSLQGSSELSGGIQRQIREGSMPNIQADFEQNLNRAKGGGSPLDKAFRAKVEPAMGVDFSDVKVHTGSEADKLSQSIQAKAFTTGKDIFFRQGEYEPGSKGGQELLAHELTHVIQQNRDVSAKWIQLQEAEKFQNLTNSLKIPSSHRQIQRRFFNNTNQNLGVREIPYIGEPVNTIGIIIWDGSPQVRMRSAPDTNSDNVITNLSFNTHIQVIRSLSNGWFFVSSSIGEMGYVASSYIWTHLPEPNAKLHRVESGNSGTAIAIAERYYRQQANDWGQDLRFYVNVLAHVNRIDVSNTANGWRDVHFQANNFIWIPSVEFARGLIGKVNSGSTSYNVADSLGLASSIDRAEQLWQDFKTAIALSNRYLADAIARHSTEALFNALLALAGAVIGATAILAVSTAVGAAIGAFAGGVGAAPGAAFGFEVGLVILKWLGLGLLVVWIDSVINDVMNAFGQFISMVWQANGNQRQLENAARQFAEAIGILIGAILEAILLLAATHGIGRAMGFLRNTRFGQSIGEGRLSQWISQRVQNVQQGRLTRLRPTGRAQTAAQLRASELRNSLSRRRTPTATSAVVDVSTGKTYYGNSGRPHPEQIHPLLRERMPNPSLESWPVHNCAEFKAINNALRDGARITNLEVHTVRTITGEAFPRCANCQITTQGATITSDVIPGQ